MMTLKMRTKNINIKDTDKLIYLVSTAQHLLKNHLIGEFKKKGLQISPSHSPILFLLEKNGPMQMNDLSSRMYIENPTMTGLIDRLEAKGLVTRVVVEHDRRKWNIAITPKGLKEIAKAKKIIHAVNEKISEGFTGPEIESFKKVLAGFFNKFNDSQRLNK